MKYLLSWWFWLLALVALPYVALTAAGSIWLYERGLLLEWFLLGLVVTVIGSLAMRWLYRKRIPMAAPCVEPAVEWPPSGHAAWQDVDAIALRIQTEDPPLGQPDVVGQILFEVLETVARHYHPKAKEAALEVPIPYALRVGELVAHDLRLAFSEYLPWSHVLTLGDFKRVKRLAAWSRELYFLYRIGHIGFNPTAALLREMRDVAMGRFQSTSTEGIKRWAVGFCIRKAGYYAIQLYGGHLVLDDVAFDNYQATETDQDAKQAVADRDRRQEEPLRILVVGQVKSGKSSLINGLFGETRAAVDVVPATKQVEPHLLEQDNIPGAVICDTAGYGEAGQTGPAFERFRKDVLGSDLVLLTCSARSAARAADRRFLDDMRSHFQRNPGQIMPPVVVVLTYIDQLRPLGEWNPPYDVSQPSSKKAEQIRAALDAVAEDLALEPDRPIIPVCTLAEKWYNLDDGLAPILLQMAPEAQRVKYVRCLRQFHEEEVWQRLWRQAVNSGRMVFKAGTAWAAARGR